MSKFINYCLVTSAILLANSVVLAATPNKVKNDVKSNIESRVKDDVRYTIKTKNASDPADRIKDDAEYTIESDKNSPKNNQYERYKGELHNRITDDVQYTKDASKASDPAEKIEADAKYTVESDIQHKTEK